MVQYSRRSFVNCRPRSGHVVLPWLRPRIRILLLPAIHRGRTAIPPTAELLMRSAPEAPARAGAIDYLARLAPDSRGDWDREATRCWRRMRVGGLISWRPRRAMKATTRVRRIRRAIRGGRSFAPVIGEREPFSPPPVAVLSDGETPRLRTERHQAPEGRPQRPCARAAAAKVR